MRTLVILIAVSLSAFGQRHTQQAVDPTTPEGRQFNQFRQESDPAKQAALMEKFVADYPKLGVTPWVLGQLLAYYATAGQPDQTMATGDKLLAIDPADPEAALQCLKAAESKKDMALIRKYSDLTSVNALKMAAEPQPREADEVEAWKQGVEYAKQVATYADYALYRVALESRDPKVTIEFAGLLAARNPKSEYAVKVQQPLFLAYRQSGANDKALALAETVLATDQSNEDMLLVVANNYLEQKKDPDKVHAYAAKIVDVMDAKPKPEGMGDADWTAHKSLVTGLAYFMSGKLYWNENKYPQADEQLRKALPLVDANAALKPETLFMLGVANYKMAAGHADKAQEAASYFRACAAIKSPFQATAATNLKRITAEYHGIK